MNISVLSWRSQVQVPQKSTSAELTAGASDPAASWAFWKHCAKTERDQRKPRCHQGRLGLRERDHGWTNECDGRVHSRPEKFPGGDWWAARVAEAGTMQGTAAGTCYSDQPRSYSTSANGTSVWCHQMLLLVRFRGREQEEVMLLEVESTAPTTTATRPTVRGKEKPFR